MAATTADYAATTTWRGIQSKPLVFPTTPDLIGQGTATDGQFLRWNQTSRKWDPVSVAPGAVEWGDIGGTLSDQTDLQAALDAKADIASLALVAFTGDYNDLNNIPTGTGNGTVTSVSAGTGLSGVPNPITTAGVISHSPIAGGALGPFGTGSRVPVLARDALGHVSALSDTPIVFPAQPPTVINVLDPAFGVVADGVTNDRAGILLAFEACRVAGGIDRIIMRSYGTGYTGTPTVALTGGFGSGETAAAVVDNPGATGQVGTVNVTARGTGHKVLAHQCGITSGNPVITCTNTAGLVNGVAVNHYTIPAGTTILSFIANTSITLSANPTASNAFAQCAFGIPFATFSGGGGSGAAADVIVGNGVELWFPPGTYRVTGGIEVTGFHNLLVQARGAIFYNTNAGDGGWVIDEFCRGMTVVGMKWEHVTNTFGNWTPRGSGCSVRVAGDLVSFIDCESYNAPEFGILWTRDRTTGPLSYGGRMVNWRSIQTAGDGIHVSNGCGGLDIINPYVRGPGDDAIGIVADYGPGAEPSNITVNGYDLSAGGYRAFALIGCKKVQIGAGLIQDFAGDGIGIGASSGATTDDLIISGFYMRNIGAGGSAPALPNRHGIVVVDAVRAKIGPGVINTTTGYGYFVASLTDVQIDLVQVYNAALGDFSLGGGLTRFSQLYRAAGALTYRGEGATVTTVAPS